MVLKVYKLFLTFFVFTFTYVRVHTTEKQIAQKNVSAFFLKKLFFRKIKFNMRLKICSKKKRKQCDTLVMIFMPFSSFIIITFTFFVLLIQTKSINTETCGSKNSTCE